MKEIIKNTIEYKYCKRCIISFLAMFLVAFFVTSFQFLIHYIDQGYKEYLEGFIIFLVIDICISVPFLIYYLYRILNMFKIGASMKVTEVKLGDAEQGAYGSMKFIVSIPDENGVPKKKKSVCTVKGALYDQYKNKNVNVCYLDNCDFIFIVEEHLSGNEI